VFIAFDLLYLNGKDLRMSPLIERKAMLKKLLRRKRSRILYLDHVEGDGRLLFEQIVAMDLDGIVCKRKVGSPLFRGSKCDGPNPGGQVQTCSIGSRL